MSVVCHVSGGLGTQSAGVRMSDVLMCVTCRGGRAHSPQE